MCEMDFRIVSSCVARAMAAEHRRCQVGHGEFLCGPIHVPKFEFRVPRCCSEVDRWASSVRLGSSAFPWFGMNSERWDLILNWAFQGTGEMRMCFSDLQ